MPLTSEQKAGYVAAIAAIWPNMSYNDVDNISDEVAEIMDTVLDSIKTCSIALAGINALYDSFYGIATGTSWRDVLAAAITTIASWIDSVRTNQTYKACVSTAAANWRSAVELALMGMRE
jgi:hypothetical protein